MNKLENITNNEIRAVIDEYIHKERDRAIMKRRLCDGKTYEVLAEEFKMSVRQIKTIVYKSQETLFKHIQA